MTKRHEPTDLSTADLAIINAAVSTSDRMTHVLGVMMRDDLSPTERYQLVTCYLRAVEADLMLCYTQMQATTQERAR